MHTEYMHTDCIFQIKLDSRIFPLLNKADSERSQLRIVILVGGIHGTC